MEETGARRAQHPLRHRDFKLMFTGLAVSTAGDWLYSIALVVYIYERTDSPGWVALASVLRLFPYIVVGPFAGAVVDRYDRRLVMFYSNVLRAACMLGIAALAGIDGPLALILLLVLVASSLTTVDGPAIGAMVPEICSEDQLGKANAALGTVENVAMIVGPALGGLFVLLGSTALAFGLNAGTFLIAALCAYALSTRSKPARAADGDSPGMLSEIRDGIKIVTGSTGVIVVMMFLFLAGLFYGHELVLVVLIAEEKLGVGGEGIGWLNAAAGIGGVAAAGVASRMAASKRADLMLAAAVTVGALPYAVMSTTDAFAVGLGAMAALGAAAIAMDVVATTLLQRTVPSDVHGRILALVDSVTVGGIFLGSVLAPVVVETVGLDQTLLLLGTIPLLALLATPKLSRINLEANRQAAELAPLVAILRTSALFEEEELTGLEAIAAQTRRRNVDKDETVVREGEPAVDIYLIVSGHFDVIAAGEAGVPKKVNELGPRDNFGEVGVLANLPRTASVVATEPAEVLEIPGSVLLDVVNREPTRSSTIIDASVRRLARTHPSLAATKKEELAHGA